MKNFSEATVIKSKLQLSISMVLLPTESCDCTVKINEKILNQGLITNPITISTHVGLTDPVDISITVKNRYHPQAIVVSGLYIDNHEILPIYQALATPPTTYIDINGTWAFKIPNFYPWLHEQTGQGWIV